MADSSVFVDGVASGAFKEAFAGLPEWATNESIVRLEGVLRDQNKILRKLADNASQRGGEVDPDQLNAALKETAKNMRGNLEEEKARQGEEKKWFQFWKDENGRQKESWSLVGSAALAAGLAIRQTFVDNKQTYDDLYASGINLVSGFDGARTGFESLQQLTSITGVRFTELAKTMQKYSGVVNAIGVEKFAQTLKSTSKTLNSFGFSTKESAELLGSYLESQRGYTDMRNKSEAEVSVGLVKFGKRVDSLSLATGMARQTLMDNIQAISQSTEAMILNGQTGTMATENTLAFIASFKDQNVGRAFLRMMTDAISPLNDTFMSFQKIGFGGFGNELMGFMKSLEGLDPEEAQKRMADFAGQNGMQMDAMVRQANLLRQTGLKAEAEDVLSKIAGIQQQSRLYRQVSDEERAKLKKSNEASKKLSDAFEKFKAQLQITFAPTADILNVLTSALEWINKAFDGIRLVFEGLDKGVISLKNWVDSILEKFGLKAPKTEDQKKEDANAKADLVNWTGLALAIGASIGALGVFGKILTTIAGNLFSKLGSGKAAAADLDMGGPSGGAGKAKRGRAGKGGPGVDSKSPGFLSKLADGLGSLGSPKVLLGIAVLAGLAGTLYLTGKALQQFSEVSWEGMGKAAVTIGGLALAAAGLGAFAIPIAIGSAVLAGLGLALGIFGVAASTAAPGIISFSDSLATFELINGQNLIDVATGVGALSAALVAFTAANAAGSVGAIFSSVAGGISKMFGGEGSPIEQIQKLSAAGEGLTKTVTALQSLAGAMTTMSTALNSITGVDKIQSIVTSVNDLNLLKAAAFSLLSPSASSAPAKSRVAGSESLDRPKNAVSPAGAPSTDSTAPNADINSSINAQRLLIEQLVKGTNELVSVNKDILRYTKLKQ